MGSDPDAKELAADGCSECGGNLTRQRKERVAGGADWYFYECDDCGKEVKY